jgi:hypothetical protein
MPHIRSNAERIRTVLIKLKHTCHKAPTRPRRDTHQALGRKAIPQKVNPACHATYKGLVGVLFNLQFVQHFIHRAHRLPQFPPRRRDYNPSHP